MVKLKMVRARASLKYRPMPTPNSAQSDTQGRLMMVINWNSDIGDAWEWAEDPYYPLQYSTYAYQVAANTFMYALSH